jgi:hypothetical protein
VLAAGRGDGVSGWAFRVARCPLPGRQNRPGCSAGRSLSSPPRRAPRPAIPFNRAGEGRNQLMYIGIGTIVIIVIIVLVILLLRRGI